MSNPLQRLNTAHRVDTGEAVQFSFEGKSYQGCKGDTLASALIANGVKVVGRSFKLHRPRGLFGIGREEVNGFLQLEDGPYSEANARATLTPLYQGLKAAGQNAWPNVKNDVFGALAPFHKLMPASFYYKSMIWPNWHTYEGLVRKMAGLGKAPKEPDTQKYHKRNLHCEVLIVGGGPAGLAAALAASQGGQRVVLVDEQEEFGGSLLGENKQINGKPAMEWVAATLAELQAADNVTLISRATATGYYDHNYLLVAERVTNHLGPVADSELPRERLWKIRTKEVVLTTGAIERPLVFQNNDRPGIMLASAVGQYANRYGVAAGKEMVVVTNNDSAYQTAIDLHDAGVNVVAIVDARPSVNGDYQSLANERGITIFRGYVVKNTKGGKGIKSIEIAKISDCGERLEGHEQTLKTDLVAMSGGWTPTIHLFSQSGGKLRFDDVQTCFVPDQATQAVRNAGATCGDFTLKAAIENGYAAGAAAAGVEGSLSVETNELAEQPLRGIWMVPGVPTEKQWVDFQYDVKVSDIEVAERENFVSVEHLKRYTTNGMCIDQGKTSNVNALAIMANLTSREIPDVGTTKFRPPYQPTTINTFGGRTIGQFLRPKQQMPSHSWHVANGGHMEDYGFLRPDCYLRAGETDHDAINREVISVRNGVGMFEGSPLGKIEVKGPDAAELLTRFYINNAKSLKPGFCRYGLMLNENGIVIDDGVFLRLAEDHYWLHTTSGGAARIYMAMEEWLQCEWPDLDVMISNVTSQWANVTVSGPKARDVMSKLECDIDLSAEAFPHMTFRDGTLMGVPCRIVRASFNGELTYEVNVPARYGLSLWETVYEAGQEFDITPYGIESLMVMRTEKGYLHIGADTDGNTVPDDLGWGFPISKKPDDFIGRRSLSRPAQKADGRFQFVGLESADGTVMTIGGHIIATGTPVMPIESQGYVTSAHYSPTLGKNIALGIVKDGFDRKGEDVFVYANGKTTQVKIVDPVFFDQKGDRLNV